MTEQIFNTHDDSGGNNKGMGIYQHSSNKIGLSTYNGTAGQYPFSHEIVSGFWADTDWHHIAVVYDSSDEKAHIYKDGSLQISQSKNSASFVAGAPQGALKMGERVSANNRDLNSLIDDVGIYSRALTSTEITALYNSGTGAAVSTLSNRAGLKAHYGMNTNNGTAATLDDDLSSYADQAASDEEWLSQDTAKRRVNV